MVEDMARAEVWTKRIKEWRASGLRSDDFCAGRGFSPALLRHWAWRLGLTRRRRRADGSAAASSQIRIARVVRVPSGREGPPPKVAAVPSALQLAVGDVRIVVAPGFDSATLSAVLDLLEKRAGSRSSR